MNMKELFGIREMLCEELSEFSGQRELSAADLDAIHKLASSIKNIDKSPCLKAATTAAMMGIPAMTAIPATGLPGAPPTTEAARIGARGILWAGTAVMRARQRI